MRISTVLPLILKQWGRGGMTDAICTSAVHRSVFEDWVSTIQDRKD